MSTYLMALGAVMLGLSQLPDPVQRGAELLRQDRLLEAEKVLREGLEALPERERGACYEHLLGLYIRLDRIDRALGIGARYEAWLGAHPQADRLRVLHYEIGWCYFTLGHLARAEPYLRQAVAAGAVAPLPIEKHLAALLYLARAAQRRGDAGGAEQLLRDLDKLARQHLAQPTIAPELRAACVWHLADSQRARQQVRSAAAELQQLLGADLTAPTRLKTLQLLAGDQVQLQDLAAAEKSLRAAIGIHEGLPGADRMTFGDLAVQLSVVLKQQKRMDDAGRWQARAAEAYRAVLDDPRLGRPYQVGAVEAFWKLQGLFQESWQLQNALQLLARQTEQWASPALLEPRLRAEDGQLQLALGALAQAKDALRRAVAQLEAQQPFDLRELPRAYLNCGTAELMSSGADAAAALGSKNVVLYRRYHLPDDVVLADTHNLLGSCAAQSGDYTLAMTRYREGLAVCERLGTAAASQRCNLLLNVALLYQAQGDLAEALRLCEQAQAAYESFAEPDSFNLAIFHTARISIQLGRGKIEEAFALTGPTLSLCRAHKVDSGPVLTTARHAQGMHALARRDLAGAEKAWQEVRLLQEQEQGTPLLPRTLNYLGIVADLLGRPKDAETHWRRALELQKGRSAYPATHFITLWRLAELLARGGNRREARSLLAEALGIADRARLRVFGDAQARAAFFAQFRTGFDRDVEWCVADGDPEAALAGHMRSRGRSLQEYLQSAGVDPRQQLTGPAGAKLLQQEAELKRRLSAARAQGWGLAAAGDGERGTRALAQAYEADQEEYARVWRDILASSEIYNRLAAPDLGPATLARLRQALAPAGTTMLVYHFGRERSFLFLVGAKVDVFELTAPEDVVQNAVPLAPLPAAEVLGSARGLGLKLAAATALPVAAASSRRVPLTYRAAGALVDHYRVLIADPAFAGTRGLAVRSGAKDAQATLQRPDLLGDVLLPPAARAKIRAAGLAELLVVPDGPLHRLPLEAVLLETGANPRYVLDELPPLVYAPSLAIVAHLLDRAGEPRPQAPSLLTVCNPAYDESSAQAKRLGDPRLTLPRLPFTAVESRQVRRLFDPARVTVLEADTATERAVVDQMRDKTIIHVAAHGLADESFDNLFGALALTPSTPAADIDPGNDGFLALHEIHTLPLKRCQLAVLSACVTNVGPQAPLESGVTIASGFLAAGAQRVVASHWSVDDAATAQLMETFFAALTAAPPDQPLSYAHALQQGRSRLRHDPRTAAPFYWAPFVLIGPPTGALQRAR